MCFLTIFQVYLQNERQTFCKTRENFNFLKNSKMIISVKIQNFSRYRMTKRTSPLESSPEIKLPCQISSNSETVGNCTYFEAIGQMSK